MEKLRRNAVGPVTELVSKGYLVNPTLAEGRYPYGSFKNYKRGKKSLLKILSVYSTRIKNSPAK